MYLGIKRTWRHLTWCARWVARQAKYGVRTNVCKIIPSTALMTGYGDSASCPALTRRSYETMVPIKKNERDPPHDLYDYEKAYICKSLNSYREPIFLRNSCLAIPSRKPTAEQEYIFPKEAAYTLFQWAECLSWNHNNRLYTLRRCV